MKKEFKNMEFTGERFVPEVHGNIELEHLHRYRLAMNVSEGKMVLDIASGEGFGSAMLARVATSVTGVDISHEAVSHSQAKYKANNLNFLVGSCSSIPFEDATFDVVVSFETIEHHLEHEAMMKEIKRVLRPAGLLVISSPDKLEYSDKTNFCNPHHVKELYRDEFKELLGSTFHNYSFYGQRVVYGSAIFCEDRVTSVESYYLTDDNFSAFPGIAQATYLVAIASDGELPCLGSGLLEQSVTESEVLHPLTQAIGERDGKISSLIQVVTERDRQLASLTQVVTERDRQLASLTQVVTERDRQLASLTQVVTERDRQIKRTLNSRSWRITFPLRAAATLVRTRMPYLRTVLASVRKIIKGDVGIINPKNTSNAADMAVARTGRNPSETYLAAISPIDLSLYTSRRLSSLPKYSIIILQYNKVQLTINCINSILRYTSLDEIEIIVVDNGSNQTNIDALEDYRALVHLIEIGVNRYYGEGNNLGVEFAKGEFIILMNNDIAVTSGWFENISLELKDGVGAVGPCFIYPDDVVQEAGGYVTSDGNVEQRYKQQKVDALPNESFECDYVSGALLLMRKSDFIKTGGFDLCWEPAYYEDVDLCLKLRLLGLKTVCSPVTKVYHVENATSSDKSLNLGLESIVEANKAKFVTRWGAYLSGNSLTPAISIVKSDPDFVGMTIGSLVEVINTKPHALIYTPYVMTPGGGERFCLSICAALREEYNVTIAFTHQYSTIRLKQMAEYFGMNLDGIEIKTIDKAIVKTKLWDLAFVLGNSLSPSIQAPCPRSFYICQFPFDHKKLRKKHLPLMEGYAYICYSKFVSSFIESSLKRDLTKEIHVLYPPVKAFSGSNQKCKKIISIGRFFTGGHCKNQHILIEIFKKLIDQNPDLLTGWELVLAGSTRPEVQHRKYISDCQAKALGYPIRFLLDASSVMLATELADASIYWHGAGIDVDEKENPECLEHFGITPLEAASAGCLVVVHKSGGPGELADKFPDCIFSYQTADDLHRLTLKIMQIAPDISSSLRDATNDLAECYSYEQFKINLFSIINKIK